MPENIEKTRREEERGGRIEKEPLIKREDFEAAYKAAETARQTPEGKIIFKEHEKYVAIEQGHGFQDYSHESSEEEYNTGKEDNEAALQVFIFSLRDRGYDF